mmetsp:Transcript_22302/g.33845  ORF Transcript_22302/g.33845 Transcript_22302/m.33845 type:complete len:191 (-) Transcript_22302:832-1404(-)
MLKLRSFLTLVLLYSLSLKALAFTTNSASRISFARRVTNHHHTTSFSWRLRSSSAEEDSSPAEKYDPTTFKTKLSELEKAGVRLLSCDAKEVNTLSSALWSTMADLSADDGEQRVCLVLESIPAGALEAFVQDFTVLKTQMRLMQYVPELARFSISLVAKGPAFFYRNGCENRRRNQSKKRAHFCRGKLR